MSDAEPQSDRDLLRRTWRTYDEQFAAHVGDIVTPYDYVDTEEEVNWAARVFMFAYALGSVAGANAVAPEAVDAATDEERVANLVDHVIDVQRSDDFAVTSARIRQDMVD